MASISNAVIRIDFLNLIDNYELIQIVLYKCGYYMEENFIEIKAENADIALVTTRLSNADIGKIFS